LATHRINITVVLLVLIVLVMAVTGWVLYTQLRTDEITTHVSSGEIVRLLVVAHEENQPFLSFLLFYHPETHRAAVLDIPGNTGMVLRPLGRIDRIDAVFDGSQPQAFTEAVEEAIGASVSHWMTFDADGFVDFINLLGGMELFVINDYRDMDESEPVLLPTGSALLDGEKAVEYLRLPGIGESELEEVGKRQTFVQALLKAIKNNETFLQHPDVQELRSRLVDSSLDDRAQTSLFGELARIDPERIIRRRVQGTLRDVDVEGVTRQLLFPHFEGQWLRQAVRQVDETLEKAEEEVGQESTVIMEVLNGTASSGLARRTSELYEDFGYEVLRFGNAESDQIEHTLVIDRRGIGETAQRVARVIEANRVVVDVVDSTDVDVTLILGRDFDGTVVRTR
jgi:polyisoprenyl-teichoic acid--peptidoglycan teichoic acid transferase